MFDINLQCVVEYQCQLTLNIEKHNTQGKTKEDIMNINFLNNLVTELIVTKEDIIIALTEGEVNGWKR